MDARIERMGKSDSSIALQAYMDNYGEGLLEKTGLAKEIRESEAWESFRIRRSDKGLLKLQSQERGVPMCDHISFLLKEYEDSRSEEAYD